MITVGKLELIVVPAAVLVELLSTVDTEVVKDAKLEL